MSLVYLCLPLPAIADGLPAADPARFAAVIDAFEAEDRRSPPPSDAYVFYGSSSIVGWADTLEADMAPLPVVARGFGGSTMADALHYARRMITPLQPRAVILYEGDNDIGAYQVSLDQLVTEFRDFVALLAQESPATNLYFVSIKPSPHRWQDWPQMLEANAMIRTICDTQGRLHYIDVASEMLGSDGEPRPDLFIADGLHMNRAGYQLWTDAVRAALLPDD